MKTVTFVGFVFWLQGALFTGIACEDILQSANRNSSQFQMQEKHRFGMDVIEKDTNTLLREESDWKNELILWWMPDHVKQAIPRWIHIWIRNYISGNIVYFGLGGLWAYYIYFCFGTELFGEKMPGIQDCMEQIKVSMLAMPWYSLLPTVTELMVEQGWTKAYQQIQQVGIGAYLMYFIFYMTIVEFGVYWMHRELHEIKILYKLLHHPHHVYNKEHTLSPFASLAFHPLDGILQAIPYTLCLFIIPMHFLTHEMLLFATGIWTINIHDCLHGNVKPIMGAGWHLIHHTSYKHNYGHYFIFMDYLFGTLLDPEEQQKPKGN